MIFVTMTVSILGCGWYGTALAESLINKWIKVKGSTTTATKLPLLAEAGIEPYLLDLSTDNLTIDPVFFECDILWVCIPPKARTGNGAKYLTKIERLITLIKTYQVNQVVFISSTGVYGDNNTEVTEMDAPNPDSEAGKVLLAAEELLNKEDAFTTTIIRFAGLIGPGRDPGRFFAAKTNIANGLAPVNLIHLTDCVGISNALLDKQAFGYTYNAVSPSHPTRMEFYIQATINSDLQVPQFIEEKNNWKLVSEVTVSELLDYQYQVKI